MEFKTNIKLSNRILSGTSDTQRPQTPINKGHSHSRVRILYLTKVDQHQQLIEKISDLEFCRLNWISRKKRIGPIRWWRPWKALNRNQKWRVIWMILLGEININHLPLILMLARELWALVILLDFIRNSQSPTTGKPTQWIELSSMDNLQWANSHNYVVTMIQISICLEPSIED